MTFLEAVERERGRPTAAAQPRPVQLHAGLRQLLRSQQLHRQPAVPPRVRPCAFGFGLY
jgi:hypothetical protein